MTENNVIDYVSIEQFLTEQAFGYSEQPSLSKATSILDQANHSVLDVLG